MSLAGVSRTDLEVVQVPRYGKPKVLCAKVWVDRHFLEASSEWQTSLAIAKEQAYDMIRQNIGTAVGQYSIRVEEDKSLFGYGKYVLVLATWTSRCRAIQLPKPPLEAKDIFGG